jgi:hypothetical protein
MVEVFQPHHSLLKAELNLQPTVRRPVRLGAGPLFRLHDHNLNFIYSHIYLLLLLLSDERTSLYFVVCDTDWSESRRARNYILISHFRLPQPGGPRREWPNYSSEHWVPFSPSLTAGRVTVEVSQPASTMECRGLFSILRMQSQNKVTLLSP